MKICRYFVVLIVVLYSSVHATSQGGGNSQDQVMACAQKLLPCQPYLHKLNPPPPPTCCGPLKDMVEKDPPCLCAVFNNPEILKTLNLTKENALDLPKACGANPNVSLCTKAAASPPTASPGSTTKGRKRSSAPALNFNGFSLVSAFVAMIFF